MNHHFQKKILPNVHYDILIGLMLTIGILIAYQQVKYHKFVAYDDQKYVTENRHVLAGLTPEGVIWSFTSTHASNWHPMTWLSHMLDIECYGTEPGAHHLSNVSFHIFNTLLLFLVFRRMSRNLWQSVFVAALFAFHPLHVESVAWVSERKDLLSTFFGMLTLWFYICHVEHSERRSYLLMLLFFMLGLMSKPMLVTLPFVLLLLDYWPLRRLQLEIGSSELRDQIPSLLWEKMPLFILMTASCGITFLAQQSGGAVRDLETYSFYTRIANALISYVAYLGKMIWPCNLTAFYPHPETFPLWQVTGSLILILSMSALVIRQIRQQPYLAVGWLWYIGTLVPVIGVVQVGSQAMADRYTYIPLIGIFIMIAWGIPDFFPQWRYRTPLFSIIAAMILLTLTTLTWVQTRYWSDSTTLFKRMLEVNDNNHMGHGGLGVALANQGKIEEAMRHYLRAIRLRPRYATAHSNLGLALLAQGKTHEARIHFAKAVAIKAEHPKFQNNLGVALAKLGDRVQAIVHFKKAIQINPEYAEAYYNLAKTLKEQGRNAAAITHFKAALFIRPDHTDARYMLANTLAATGNMREAIVHFKTILQFDPDNAEAHRQLGTVLSEQKYTKAAIFHLRRASELQPDDVTARHNLGVALLNEGKVQEAIIQLEEVVRIRPWDKKAHDNLEKVLAIQKKGKD